jgi:hypothetical protein
MGEEKIIFQVTRMADRRALELTPMGRLVLRYSAHDLTRMVELFFPEERRHEFTSEPWDRVSFRHYRDPKIICIEHYRRVTEGDRDPRWCRHML